jgi:hypothetical protein
MGSREEERRSLERELTGGDYRVLLQRLETNNASYGRFESWAEVIAFMRAIPANDPRTDEVLKAIFCAYRDDRDPRWRTILLTIFWPELECIHHFKRRWDPDLEALWTNTTWAFLQTIDGIDVRSRPERLGQKIFNDTLHRLHDAYRQEWNWVNRIVVPKTEEGEGQDGLESLMGGQEAVEFAEVDLQQNQEVEIRRLRRFVSRGLISEAGFLVIVGTRIYGNSLSEFAGDHGLDYETAKKRRQRVEAKIRRLGRKQKKP